ncbi:MAG: RagB/SusD family nutrient uptake outer membrane protein [Bacteroidales bacterium]|nr:RagB/SusD family nutrient uptake outer membrane protein [Bacteroidales bacterium]
MKTRNIFMTAIAGLTLLAAVSCSDKLDIAQHGVLNYDTYYNTDEDIEAAEAAMYLEVLGWEYNVKLTKDMLTDDFYAGGAMRGDNANLEALNEFTFDAEEDYIQNMFTTYYTLIYKANVILGHVDESLSDIAKRARAEAKVFRAFAYFDLISMWGNPPVVDHELAPSEYNVPNGSTEELWNMVVTDLTEAISSGYLSEKTSVSDKTTWHVTKQFAQALLGKAYLWMAAAFEDDSYYSLSADAFDEVIESELYDLVSLDVYPQMATGDNKYNCENIFESNRVYDSNNSWQNFTMYGLMIGWRTDRFVFGSLPIASLSWGFRVPKQDLYEAFVADEGADGARLNATIITYDQIKSTYGASITAGNTIVLDALEMWKGIPLEDDIDPGTYGYCWNTDCIWMRYAEVLLCAAEAHFQAGNTDKATTYLNKVRNRAGLADITATLDAIKLEKRLELCGESVRFQDLLRWGEAADVLADNGEIYPVMSSNGTVTYTSCNNSVYGFKTGKHEHLPYPATEIRLNSEIQQNAGY